MPPPMSPSPPQKQGPNVGLIVGLGCLGLLVLGGLGVGALAMISYRRASSAMLSPPPPYTPPRTGSGTAPTPTTATGTLKIELRDLRNFKGSGTGSRYFIGELVNTGDAPISHPSARVTLLDASGTALDSAFCASMLRDLAPGEKVPCTFLSMKSGGFATTRIEATPTRSYTTKPAGDLDVQGVKFTPKKGYSPHVLEGKVTNRSSFKVKPAWVLVSLYGADGKLVGVDQTLVAGSDLEGGASALFSAKVYNVAAPPVTYQVKAVGYGE